MKIAYRVEDKAQIIAPEGEWKEHTYYLVEVSHSRGNPVHLAVFAVGFLSQAGIPNYYSEVWNNTYDNRVPYRKIYYMKVIKELFNTREDE